MIERPFWKNRIEEAWKEAPIVWLAGVRRSGKTTLAQSFGEGKTHYINCDLPYVEDATKDPELFYRNLSKGVVVFDEIHQLKDPARLLKIGADMFSKKFKILATGSSTLAAGAKFRDTLTGRKRIVHLTPVLWSELDAFNNTTLIGRLYRGGLPQAVLSEKKSPSFYREWMDSFFARDIQRLFGFRNIDKFNTLFEFIMKQSGGLLDISKTASALGISRETAFNHIKALETTHAVTLVRPFYGSGQKELVRMPKVYGFDTGFVSFCKGWEPLRSGDYGILWEHIALEFFQANFHEQKINYWRDTSGHEIDFIIPGGREEVHTIECKWDASRFDNRSLKVFRTYYPKGKNFIVAPVAAKPYKIKSGNLAIIVCNPEGLPEYF